MMKDHVLSVTKRAPAAVFEMEIAIYVPMKYVMNVLTMYLVTHV